MGTTVRRGTRLLALALSTGTLTAAATGVAGASTSTSSTVTTHTVRTVVANATGSALEITINLPKGVALPDGSTSITQSVSLTNGAVSTVGAVSALANSLLGKGNVPLVSSLLAKSVHSSLTNTKPQYQEVAGFHQAPIDLGVGTLSSVVSSPASVVNGTVARGQSELAHLAIAGSLPAAQIAAPVLKTLTNTLSSQLQSGSSTVAGVVNSTIDQLNKQANGAATPVAQAAKQAAAQLQSTLSSLSSTLSALSNASSAKLVSLDVINAMHNITQQASTVTAHAESALADINVLNGLVSVTGIKSSATASAAGKPGTAHTSFSTPLLHVSIAHGALDLLLDQTGLHVKSGVDALDQIANQLGGSLPNAINTVDGLLNAVAGISVAYGPATHYESPDGTQAWADVAATALTIDPGLLHTAGLLNSNQKFITVKLVPTHAFAGTKATVLSQRITNTQLPHTGGNLPLVAGIGSALLALAFVGRRRFMGSSN